VIGNTDDPMPDYLTRFSLANQRALVTGASCGLGAEPGHVRYMSNWPAPFSKSLLKMTDEIVVYNAEPQLPALPTQMLPAFAQLTNALGIPREALAPDDEIAYAWRDLPREIAEIPAALRGELVARMCVAVSTGLSMVRLTMHGMRLFCI
jgi:hypothetical protein